MCKFKYQTNFAGIKTYEHAFDQYIKSPSNITSFSFGQQGIIALFDDGRWDWTVVSKNLNKLIGQQKCLPIPVFIVTDEADRYYIRFADGSQKWMVDASFSKAVNDSKVLVSSVALSPRGGWYILFENGCSIWHSLPYSLHRLLIKHKEKNMAEIKFVSISPHGKWIVVYDDGTWNAKLPPMCRKIFGTAINSSTLLRNVWLGKRGMFIIQYDILQYVEKKRISHGNVPNESQQYRPKKFFRDFYQKLSIPSTQNIHIQPDLHISHKVDQINSKKVTSAKNYLKKNVTDKNKPIKDVNENCPNQLMKFIIASPSTSTGEYQIENVVEEKKYPIQRSNEGIPIQPAPILTADERPVEEKKYPTQRSNESMLIQPNPILTTIDRFTDNFVKDRNYFIQPLRSPQNSFSNEHATQNFFQKRNKTIQPPCSCTWSDHASLFSATFRNMSSSLQYDLSVVEYSQSQSSHSDFPTSPPNKGDPFSFFAVSRF